MTAVDLDFLNKDKTLRSQPLLDSCASLLSKFHTLEVFTITRSERSTGGSQVPGPREWLGELAEPETWRRICRSIEMVHIYGRRII